MSDQFAEQLKRDMMKSACVLLVALGIVFGLCPNEASPEPRSPETIATIDSSLTDSTVLTGKVVYVDFWASWCVPCRKSYPWMSELASKYRDAGLEVVTINLDKEKTAADKFLGGMKTSLPVIYDPKGTLAKFYELKVMPSSFVYGRDGILKANHEGFQTSDGPVLDSLIASLLKEPLPK